MPVNRVRRSAVLLLAAVTVALAAVGCGGSDADNDVGSGPVKLSFWSWVPNMDQVVELWNKKHPKVRVELQNIPAGPQGGYAKMFSAVKAKNAPDVAQIETDHLASFLLAGGLEDITEQTADARGRFSDWQWGQGVFGGKTYAVPQDSGPMGLFYRKDLFDKWGIEPPKTWEEFTKAAQRVRDEDPKARITSFGPDGTAWLAGLSSQAGARWFGAEKDAWRVGIDDAASRKVFDYWGDLAERDLVEIEPTFSSGWYAHLQDGTVATWVAPYWGDTILRAQAPKTAGKWRVAPLPQWKPGGKVSGNWGGSTTAVMKGTDHVDAAADFALWLNSDPEALKLLAPNVGWPAAKSAAGVSGTDRNADFYGGQDIGKVFSVMDQGVAKDWKWGPTTDGLYKRMQDGLTRALSGDGDLASVLGDTQRSTVEELKSKGMEVTR